MSERDKHTIHRLGIRLVLATFVSLLIVTIWCPHASASPVSEAFFHMSCHDDLTLVHSVGADCRQYLMCHSGVMLTGACPQRTVNKTFLAEATTLNSLGLGEVLCLYSIDWDLHSGS
ncbi:hypothetical protein PoB_004306600 [Plakobranchus ocellatus]|uniref:Secreted protein n=1 Tax=Plakobranchus ocellatus TaxID=259542 RepID=A0AAV4BCM4_9GAST|nr:hypothetical protein PoB_004306600 [Plakobranchus ocellatus]